MDKSTVPVRPCIESQVLNCENHNSGNAIITDQELPESQTNNTEINNTDSSGTDINPIPSSLVQRLRQKDSMRSDLMEERNCTREYLEERLEIEILKEGHPYDTREFDEIFEILLDTLCSNKKTIRISGDEKPIEVVKSVFIKLDSSHIEYALECFKKNTTEVRNMACLITICSWMTIPSMVPFTMQTFAVFLALLLLGGKDGVTAIMLYVLMGCVGLPVFSGFQGGVGHLLGPTGGYIIGFMFTAFCYLLLEPLFEKSKAIRIFSLILGLMLCYVVGTLWFRMIYGMRGINYSFWAVLSMCVIPYVIPDAIKLILALFLSEKIRRAVKQ